MINFNEPLKPTSKNHANNIYLLLTNVIEFHNDTFKLTVYQGYYIIKNVESNDEAIITLENLEQLSWSQISEYIFDRV